MFTPRFSKIGWLFLLRVAIVYGLLLLPWPGVGQIYDNVFLTIARSWFSNENWPRELTFVAVDQPRHGTTRIEIANNTLMASDGSGPVRNLDIDTNGFCRVTALLITLILMTPTSWSRKGIASILGLLILHGFFLCVVAFSIWNESRYVALAPTLTALPPFWLSVSDKFQQLLVSQLNIAVPVLIWLVAAFRRTDLKSFFTQVE